MQEPSQAGVLALMYCLLRSQSRCCKAKPSAFGPVVCAGGMGGAGLLWHASGSISTLPNRTQDTKPLRKGCAQVPVVEPSAVVRRIVPVLLPGTQLEAQLTEVSMYMVRLSKLMCSVCDEGRGKCW